MADDSATTRSSDAVSAALVDATAALLAERGSALTLRDIEARSGINKGQVHHYFGGKQALIEEAMRQLAREHYHNRQARAASGDQLALSLGLDEGYWQALVRLVLDGDLATASLEFDEGISVPRDVIDQLCADRGLDQPTTDLKAEICAIMALELGWAAFAPFIELAVGVADDQERAAIVDRLQAAAQLPGS